MAPTDCPTCGRLFGNRNGMSVHHAHQHPDEWEDRFRAYVDVGDDDECWEWEASTDTGGYGRMRVGGESRKANRLAYLIAYGGPIRHVLHHCDNPACCNPSHLYEGSHSDNMRDKRERGRFPTTLSESDVVRIRRRYAQGDVAQNELAEAFGVSRANIGYIINGDRWAFAPGPIKNEDYRPHIKFL